MRERESTHETIVFHIISDIVRLTPHFKGKGRIIRYLMHNRPSNAVRQLKFASGGSIECRLTIPYEMMVWLRQEEQAELRLLNKLLKRGQTFVDCGANIGLWALTAAEVVGYTGHVIAIEPARKTYSRLANHRGEKYPQIELVNAAIGADKAGVRLLCPEEHNLARIVHLDVPGAVLVPSLKLDEIVAQRPVHGIKIDVEGMECIVLKGAAETIARCHPWLIVEFNTLHSNSATLGNWDAHRIISEHGYEARLIEGHTTLNSPPLPTSWTCHGYRNILYTSRAN